MAHLVLTASHRIKSKGLQKLSGRLDVLADVPSATAATRTWSPLLRGRDGRSVEKGIPLEQRT